MCYLIVSARLDKHVLVNRSGQSDYMCVRQENGVRVKIVLDKRAESSVKHV